MTYALPTVTTCFDLLNSTVAPEPLLARAAELRLAALGVVDATTLGHVRLARAAQVAGVHLVFGATLWMDDGFRLRVLARDATGYRNLCQLISFQAQGAAPLPYSCVRDRRHGLYILCGGVHGALWATLADDEQRALWKLAQLQSLVERDDRLLVECQPADAAGDLRRLDALIALAHRAGARAVATHDTRVLHPDEGRILRLLSAIRHHSTFWSDDPRLPPWSPAEAAAYALPDPASWQARWRGHEPLLAESAHVLRDCDVELLGRKRFPGASLPAADVFDALWRRAFAGLQRRRTHLTPELIAQLVHEINEVMAQEVGPFLLCAADLVERAAARKIKMVLQGSGTGSLLCFALGISPVDPETVTGLVFERFCGQHRGLGDLPDLDFGVPAGREAEIRELLIEMFGAARVANLSAVVSLRDRGAIRQAAQAFGYDNLEIKLLHRKRRDGGELDRYERMVVTAAEAIAGQPHHVMRHSSGVVVADEPLAELFGVGRGEDGPLLLADKDDAEALQVLKFDVLAWYLLAIYDQAEASIQAAFYPPPELWQVPGEDPRTAELLAHVDTRSIPYLQSPAMMTLMRALKVRTEADIALCLGALRPGASTTRPRLLAAIHGGTAVLEGWAALSPQHQAEIDAVLADSRGALIFDEDLLRLVHLMGFSLADAERLRRAMRKGGQARKEMIARLHSTAQAKGWSAAEVDVVLSWLVFIQRYTFMKGHAVALAHAAWRVARIAAHYPTHFYAAVLDHLGLGVGGGMYPVLVYVTEARAKGLHIQGPGVNGAWHTTPDGTTLRCGLTLLQSALSEETLRAIHAAACARPFSSVADLRARVSLSAAELEHLIAAGALDELVASRRAARWEAQLAHVAAQPELLVAEPSGPAFAVEAESTVERAAEEYATLGFTLSLAHPLTLYADVLTPFKLVPAARLERYVGRRVHLAGIVVGQRRIHTTSGHAMGFASVCDASGVAELTFFETVLERCSDTLRHGAVVVAAGLVTDHAEHGVGLEVQTLQALEPSQLKECDVSLDAEWKG